MEWKLTQRTVAKTIADLGFSVTLQKPDGSSIKTSGVWGTKESKDIEPAFPSAAYNETKVLYVPGSLKKTPEPGDNVVLGTSLWSVTKVEEYKPATVVLAFKVEVAS